MKRVLMLWLTVLIAATAVVRSQSPAAEKKLWWERGADKWYFKDDWKGLALTGGRSYRKVVRLPDEAESGWIVIWGRNFYRLTVNGTVVDEDYTSGIIEDHDLTSFVRGAREVTILVESRGRIVAEGEVVSRDAKRFPFATGDDWEIPGSSKKPTARPMIAGPSTGAFHRAHNGLLMTYNDEEKGKTFIAKGFARIQKLNDQSLFLLRGFCPASEVIDLSDATLRSRTESAIQPPMAEARKILEQRAVPAQKSGNFRLAIEDAADAAHLLSAAEAAVESAIEIYTAERDVLHLQNCLAIMSSRNLPLPDLSHDIAELKRTISSARRDHSLLDYAGVFKTVHRAQTDITRLKEQLSATWGRAIGGLDDFPNDRFGWLNARELMGHDPARWEFNISPDSVACLDLAGLWDFRTDPLNEGEKKGWHSADKVGQGWQRIYAPRAWEWQGVQQINDKSPSDCPYRLSDRRTGDKPYNGYAWYRKSVFVPESWSGQTVVLKIGQVNNWLQVFVNGKKVLRQDILNRPSSLPCFTENWTFRRSQKLAVPVLEGMKRTVFFAFSSGFPLSCDGVPPRLSVVECVAIFRGLRGNSQWV